MEKLSVIAVLVFTCISLASPSPLFDDYAKVETDSFWWGFATTVKINGLGSIKGKTARTVPDEQGHTRDIVSFTGIPYATILKRFSRAVLKTPLTTGKNVFDATKPQVACWQVASPLQPGPFTEDCLSLNIYTPQTPTLRKLPVIVFIHGGSFVRWSGNMFDGARLLNKNIVLVTINYRLGAFGFSTFENDDTPGNLGLYDQVLALQWVQNYISHFNGDPNRVTIAGQSAGAASVLYLLDSPLAKGLFHGALSSSGTSIVGWAEETPALALTNTLTSATLVGCYDPNATEHDLPLTLACMRASDPATLANTVNYLPYVAPTVQSYPLTIPKVTPNNPHVSLVTSGLQSAVPLVIGSNKNDGSFLLSRLYTAYFSSGLLSNPLYVQYQLFTDLMTSSSFGLTDPVQIAGLKALYLGAEANSGVWAEVAPGLVDVYSAFYFKSPAFATANGHSVFANTWLYSFDYYGTQTLYPYIGGVSQVPRGVTHVDDLMYVFYFGDFTLAADKSMSTRLIDIWTNFATNGNPNEQNWYGGIEKTWPKWGTTTGQFYKINSIPSVATNYPAYWVGATPLPSA